MEQLQAEVFNRLRATILELVYENQRLQRPRLRASELLGTLDRLHHECSRNDLYTLLQDLKEREYLDYESTRDRDTRRETIAKIHIKPKGRSLVEKNTSDPDVVFD